MKVTTFRSAITEQMRNLERVRFMLINLSKDAPNDYEPRFNDIEMEIQSIVNYLYMIMTIVEMDEIQKDVLK